MKPICIVVLFLAALTLASCAHPLEQLVDAHHQARIDAANANLPLARGASDGLGAYIAQSHDAALQIRANP